MAIINKEVELKEENEKMVISSNDDVELKLSDHYVLANYKKKHESALSKKFKNSILGADIGIKSKGFTSIAILSSVIAVSVALVMYFIWRF